MDRLLPQPRPSMTRLLFLALVLLAGYANAQTKTYVDNQSLRVNNISELRSLTATNETTIVVVLGTTAMNDGNGDIFFWVPTSVLADNGLTVVAVNDIPTGRYIRLRTLTVKTGKGVISGLTLTTSYVVTHNLGAVPGTILTEPTSPAAGSAFANHHISARTATTFTITFGGVPGIGFENITFDWLVRL